MLPWERSNAGCRRAASQAALFKANSYPNFRNIFIIAAYLLAIAPQCNLWLNNGDPQDEIADATRIAT
jgi:hypothetical protein